MSEPLSRLAVLFLLLLPWQTRFLYDVPNDLSVYLSEFVLLLAVPLLRPLPRWFLWLFGMLIVSIFASPVFFDGRAIAINASFQVMCAALAFVLLSQSRLKIQHMAYVFCLALLPACAIGFWQLLAGHSPESTVLGLATRNASTLGDAVVALGDVRLLRAYGGFPHPNIFGGYVVAAMVSLVLFVVPHSSVSATNTSASRIQNPAVIELLPGVLLCIFSTALVGTFSRSAWLAAGVFIIWVAYAMIRQKTMRTAFLCIVGSLVLSVALLFPFISVRFSIHERLERQSLSQRVDSYNEFFDVIDATHWFGTGIGNYRTVLEELFPGRSPWEYQRVHSAFLLMIAELGILSVFVFAAFWRVARKNMFTHRALMCTILIPVVFLDHYAWSSWAGLALVAILFAMLCNKSSTVRFTER